MQVYILMNVFHLEGRELNKDPPNHYDSSSCLKCMYLIISLIFTIKNFKIKNLNAKPGNLN